MARPQAGRWTHDGEGGEGGGVVVLLVGMRVDRWWRPDLWLPVLVAMPRMLVELCRDPSGAHRPAWAAFNRRARGARGAVGIWHETYAAPAGGHESMYGDMSVVGLAAAVGSRPVTSATASARTRLDGGAAPGHRAGA